MINPELYEKSNYLQTRDAIKCLDEYGKKLQWKASGDRVLDIGCGDGRVTNIFKNNYMPPEYGKVVGCDISENMIKFANEHHADRKTEFHVLDIQGKVPEAFRGNFDHVVSFTALHWVKKQEAAFRNIHELLADNGDCLLLFFGHMPVSDAYRTLSRHSKWSKWLTDVERFISPYQDSTEPVQEITNLLRRIGFKYTEVTCKPNEFVFDETQWKNTMESIDPFGIPKEEIEAYLKDLTEVTRNLNMECNRVEKGYFTLSYTSVIIYARK